MPRNLELKARISSQSEAVQFARSLHAQSKGILLQRDIYYKVSHGRLKLRIINNHNAELIFYHRPNKKGSRYSDYFILPVDDAARTNALCTSAFGQKGVVEKKRRLFLFKNSRIHLDVVRGLGTFIEFEVQVKYGKQQAQKLLELLSHEFNIRQSSIVPGSYSDLLFNRRRMKKV
jgi:predicted adenylyl cyclase CyaB